MCKFICLWLLLTGIALAQPLPQEGQVYESKSVDLNGDGSLERVVLVAYNLDRGMESFFGQLRVLNSQGGVIWQGPRVNRSGVPFAFGSWIYGASQLVWLGDIDGDRKIELISSDPVSDIRPYTFQRYRWEGNAFRSLGPKMLLESAPGSGRYLWRDPIEWDGESSLGWVTTLSGDPTRCEAEVMFYGNGGEIRNGKALMKGDGLGLSVISWTRPMN